MERSMQQESVGLFQQANKDNIKQFLGKYGIYMVLVAMVIAMSFMSPVFLTQSNLLNIVRQVSVIGTISLGVTLVIISKGIDLSSGSTLALAAVMALRTLRVVSPSRGDKRSSSSRASCSAWGVGAS